MTAFAIDSSIAEDFRAAWGDKRRQTREQLAVVVLIVLILFSAAILGGTLPSRHGWFTAEQAGPNILAGRYCTG
jgi:hypothetical protein